MSLQRTKLLTNRGIGKKYHGMSLTEYPNQAAQEVKTWFEEESSLHLAQGRGVNIFSEKQDGYDIAILLSRALLLNQYEKLQCVHFQNAMDDDTISLIYEKHPPLCILNFHPDDVGVQADSYRRLENCLNYYLDNCIPIFLHFPVVGDGKSRDYGNLMSAVFFDRVSKTNKHFTIK
jgi:hypothetical protein